MNEVARGGRQRQGAFDYQEAFSRTIGWVTHSEQKHLRGKRVAIAGLGGVGGSHVVTLSRLGVQAFNLADMDTFDLANMNRQAGAFCSTLGQPKLDVVSDLARDINPAVNISGFDNGVTRNNLSEFLDGVDLFVDGLDFFAMDMRCAVFAACQRRGIPAITAAPLGAGTALLSFMPGSMSFEKYFCLDGHPFEEQLLRFLVGLAPRVLHQSYLVEPSAVDLKEQRGPSTPMACQMCAGVAGAVALRILLDRGSVRAAPRGLQFDAYRQKMVYTWRPAGNRNPLQRTLLNVARRRFLAAQKEPPEAPRSEANSSQGLRE